jgi:predicted porin
MVGATIPFGGGDSAFKLSYQDRNGDSKTIGATHYNADRTVYNIGYEYFLSKRTIAWIYSSFSDGDKTLQKGTAATDFANRNQYAIGMTHFF